MICSCIILIGKSRISCRFFTMIPFSLWFIYCSDQYKMGTEYMKPPFLLTFNLQFSIFPYFYFFILQKEQNLTRGSSRFFSRNQEVILSASLVGFCLIVIVGVILYLLKRGVLLRQVILLRKLF